jgi:hypothetical protein
MFNIVRRAIGWGALAIALLILGADFLKTYASGSPFSVHSIGQDWQFYSRDTYAAFQAWRVHALPMASAGYVEIALGVWTWAAIALAGILIAPFRHVAALKRYEAMS